MQHNSKGSQPRLSPRAQRSRGAVTRPVRSDDQRETAQHDTTLLPGRGAIADPARAEAASEGVSV